jgi:hypothetical protein
MTYNEKPSNSFYHYLGAAVATTSFVYSASFCTCNALATTKMVAIVDIVVLSTVIADHSMSSVGMLRQLC